MTARRVTVVLVAALVFYLVVFGERGVILLQQRSIAAKGIGAGVLMVGVVGVVLVWGEVRFGLAAQRLGRELGPEARTVSDELPRRPSGRIDRAAADEVFVLRRAQVEAAPDDWRGWFRLGIAYGDAGDTRRGRAAVRHAIDLHDARRG